MKFIRVDNTAQLEVELTMALNTELAANKHVLWLVPGGSNIAAAVKIMASLSDTNLQNLTLMLTDERYGEIGHPDSNYFQFTNAGMQIRSAQFPDVLEGVSFEETISLFNDNAKAAILHNDVIIGFFGMGLDGHIAGILPNSPAAESSDWVAGYEADQFKRITLTPFALSHLAAAYVGAFGDEKADALRALKDKVLPIAEQPAQILKHLPEAYIYNNQLD